MKRTQTKLEQADLARMTIMLLQKRVNEAERVAIQKEAELFALHVQQQYANKGEQVRVEADGSLVRTPIIIAERKTP